MYDDDNYVLAKLIPTNRSWLNLLRFLVIKAFYVVSKLTATKVIWLQQSGFLATELWKDITCAAPIPNWAEVSEYTNQTSGRLQAYQDLHRTVLQSRHLTCYEYTTYTVFVNKGWGCTLTWCTNISHSCPSLKLELRPSGVHNHSA